MNHTTTTTIEETLYDMVERKATVTAIVRTPWTSVSLTGRLRSVGSYFKIDPIGNNYSPDQIMFHIESVESMYDDQTVIYLR